MLTGKISAVSVGFLDGKAKLVLEINEKNCLKEIYDEYSQCEKLSIDIKKYRKKRSLDANAYLWVLCGKLAEKMGISKEEVYRQQIIDAGIYRSVKVSSEAADTLIKSWKMHGIGWVAELADDYADNEWSIINLYYGSSVYNTKQISRLIDNVVNECKNLNIQTMTPDEISNMMSLWEAEKVE